MAICPSSRYSASQRPSTPSTMTRLRVSYGVGGPVLEWFRSYLTGRVECIRRGMSRSTPITVRYGVPQGSVLGPLLVILYTADLIDIIEAHGHHPHLYADDTQIQGSCCPDSVDSLQSTLSDSFDEVSDWCVRIGYNSIHRRPRYSGVRHPAGVTYCQLPLSGLASTMSLHRQLFAIWAS